MEMLSNFLVLLYACLIFIFAWLLIILKYVIIIGIVLFAILALVSLFVKFDEKKKDEPNAGKTLDEEFLKTSKEDLEKEERYRRLDEELKRVKDLKDETIDHDLAMKKGVTDEWQTKVTDILNRKLGTNLPLKDIVIKLKGKIPQFIIEELWFINRTRNKVIHEGYDVNLMDFERRVNDVLNYFKFNNIK